MKTKSEDKQPKPPHKPELHFIIWTSDGTNYHIVNLPNGNQAVATTKEKSEMQLEIAKKMLKTSWQGIFIAKVIHAEGC